MCNLNKKKKIVLTFHCAFQGAHHTSHPPNSLAWNLLYLQWILMSIFHIICKIRDYSAINLGNYSKPPYFSLEQDINKTLRWLVRISFTDQLQYLIKFITCSEILFRLSAQPNFILNNCTDTRWNVKNFLGLFIYVGINNSLQNTDKTKHTSTRNTSAVVS